jgi:hypothetical protein
MTGEQSGNVILSTPPLNAMARCVWWARAGEVGVT